MLDIEAQLAKMEGLERDSYRVDGDSTNNSRVDVIDTKCPRDPGANMNQCCDLTCVLQDTLSQENESLSSSLESPLKPSEVNLAPHKVCWYTHLCYDSLLMLDIM